MSNSKPVDFCVFIGRFAPFHFGHLKIVEEALARAKHVIILCGSANKPPSFRNPWSFFWREAMIRSCFPLDVQPRIHISPLQDHTYNDAAWAASVQTTVSGYVTAHHDTPHQVPNIELIGHQKDHTSFYLKMFPQWNSHAVPHVRGFDATVIRDVFFGSSARIPSQRQIALAAFVPSSVVSLLEDFANGVLYQELVHEAAFVHEYKRAWQSSPYPPIFVTTDALVVQAGHILLVERKEPPGRGLWALPGGFIGQHEHIYAACLRELYEETQLDVPQTAIKGTLTGQRVFDSPHRSQRGRVITHAFHFALDREPAPLPKFVRLMTLLKRSGFHCLSSTLPNALKTTTASFAQCLEFEP